MNFISIEYTNLTADLYSYSNAYETLENVPIVSGATEYDYPSRNTYILIFHGSLYYVKNMTHILINPNHIQFNGLAFIDNPYSS